MHQSLATIQSPQFINLQPLDINPLMSKCEIKVLYLGKNRNGTFISKEVATEMAKTLRGAPIVGYYKNEKADFHDHGHKVIIDDEGIKFECDTVPYGFVSPDAQVWFKMFEEQDGFGNSVVREYLMTTGYLWTTQFPECALATGFEGRPQSMELDEETLKGSWERDSQTGMEFFIINDAVFSKLCILGEDVEPCFEGASIKDPEISLNFTLMDDGFKNTLYTMMQQLQFALQGGQENMENLEKIVDFEDNSVELNTTEIQKSIETSEQTTDFVETPAEGEIAPAVEEGVENESEPEIAPDTEVEVEPTVETPAEVEAVTEEAPIDTPVETESVVENVADQYSQLEAQYNQLSTDYAALKLENEELRAFKKKIEDKQKDELINKFYMLSDDEKAEVINNKDNYSLEQIESKLSVIHFRKQETAEKVDSASTEATIYTYSLEGTSGIAAIPAWVAALKNTQNNRNK